MASGPATRVSVVIPTRNRSELLREALSSVVRLSGQDLKLEILVVDDGSTDDTAAVAMEFGAHRLESHGRGTAAARNLGMRAATGDFIAFIDDDDVWTTDHLRPHIELLHEWPQLGGVVAQARPTDQDLNPVGEPWPTELPSRGVLFEQFFYSPPQIGTTVVRTSVRDTVGGMREGQVHLQDVDWHLRLARRHELGFVPVVSVFFREHRSRAIAEELSWARYRAMHRIYLWNIWGYVTSKRRVPWSVPAAYLSQMGWYFHACLQQTDTHVSSGDLAAARRSFIRAHAASPLHAAKAALVSGWYWRLARTTLVRRHRERLATQR